MKPPKEATHAAITGTKEMDTNELTDIEYRIIILKFSELQEHKIEN